MKYPWYDASPATFVEDLPSAEPPESVVVPTPSTLLPTNVNNTLWTGSPFASVTTMSHGNSIGGSTFLPSAILPAGVQILPTGAPIQSPM